MEEKKSKKWLKGLLASLLCVPLALGVLAGCGGNGTGTGSDTDSGQGSTGTGEEGGSGTGGNEGEEGDTSETEENVTFTAMSETANLDSYAQNALNKEIAYLLKLDANRLLYNFYDNAGLPIPSGAARYGGWENSLIAGHTMGHYLTALAQAYANGGTSADQKKSLEARIKSIMLGLKECQEASENSTVGAKKGFLWGANATGHKTNVEFQFDNVEAGHVNINNEAWVPWYTMHKILAGLIDVYQLTGNQNALTVATGLGDWVYDRVTKWSKETRKTVLSTEYGGMNDALYNLYAITGEEKYAVAAHQFDEDIPTVLSFSQNSMIDCILEGEANYLNGQHANTTIPKVIGLLNGYIRTLGKEIDGVTQKSNGRLYPKVYLRVAEEFWTRVVEHHSYVTGGNSNDEHFQRDDSQWAFKSNINCETCNTYNMLKLSRMLFSVTKDKKYLDYYENTYINAILSSQNPETGMTMYFQPMAPGYFKVYSSEINHFWCCTGSGMESMSKLNDSIYYDAGSTTYVAMYMSSTYKTEGVSLTMTADLENSDEVTITLDEGTTTLKLRRPDWTTKFEVRRNGELVTVADTDDFAAVEVKKGDTVTLTLGKEIRVFTLPNAAGVYAFKYGPFVLSAELGTQNTDQEADTDPHGVQVKKPKALKSVISTYQTTKDDLADFRSNINTYMTRTADGKFTLTGIEGGPLTYSIHYKQYTQRYAIYLTFQGEDSGEETSSPAFESEEIESVIQPGRGQYEGGGFLVDTNNGSTGSDGVGRYANAGGSFSYWVGVDKTAPESNYIVTSFAKDDNGKTVKFSANGTVFFEKTLNYTGTDAVYEVYIPIPSDVVEGGVENSLGDPASTATRIQVKIESCNAEASAAVHTSFKTVKVFTRDEDGTPVYKLHDSALAYFVDCGDYDVNTLSSGDKYGMLNAVTEQVYGMDPVTGRMWGVWDETASDTWDDGIPTPGSVATNSTWAYEYNANDGVAKTDSNRYTKNQFEKGWQTLKLANKFELPDGTYTVKLYFADPWGCSKNADVSANGETKLTDAACGREVSFNVTVSGGELLLEITNPVDQTANNLCINLCYIKILYA